MAFSIGNELWQFRMMPFGLCNAPMIFERVIEQILQKFLLKSCLMDLDDIIFGKSFEKMTKNFKKSFGPYAKNKFEN